MRKTLAAIVAALMLAGGLATAAAADGVDTPPEGIHLVVADIPHCYTVGLTTGSDDNPCTAAVTCTQGDVTCNWFCDNELVSVECEYIDNPGVLVWDNILYSLIDRYRAQAHHKTHIANLRTVRVRRQAHRIARLKATIRHLRHQHMG
jgi:hypothetical protein